jgi:hypothetical protein
MGEHQRAVLTSVPILKITVMASWPLPVDCYWMCQSMFSDAIDGLFERRRDGAREHIGQRRVRRL